MKIYNKEVTLHLVKIFGDKQNGKNMCQKQNIEQISIVHCKLMGLHWCKGEEIVSVSAEPGNSSATLQGQASGTRKLGSLSRAHSWQQPPNEGEQSRAVMEGRCPGLPLLKERGQHCPHLPGLRSHLSSVLSLGHVVAQEQSQFCKAAKNHSQLLYAWLPPASPRAWRSFKVRNARKIRYMTNTRGY